MSWFKGVNYNGGQSDEELFLKYPNSYFKSLDELAPRPMTPHMNKYIDEYTPMDGLKTTIHIPLPTREDPDVENYKKVLVEDADYLEKKIEGSFPVEATYASRMKPLEGDSGQRMLCTKKLLFAIFFSVPFGLALALMRTRLRFWHRIGIQGRDEARTRGIFRFLKRCRHGILQFSWLTITWISTECMFETAWGLHMGGSQVLAGCVLGTIFKKTRKGRTRKNIVARFTRPCYGLGFLAMAIDGLLLGHFWVRPEEWWTSDADIEPNDLPNAGLPEKGGWTDWGLRDTKVYI